MSDSELLGIDTPPERSSHAGKRYSQSIPRDVADAYSLATPTTRSHRYGTSVVQSPPKQPSRTRSEPHQQPATPKNKPQGFISRYLPGSSRGESTKEEKLLNSQADEIKQLKLLLDKKTKDQEHELQRFRHDWQRRDEEFRQRYEDMCHHIRDLTSDRDKIQEQYETLILRQREESFAKMESGRWLPLEESRVQQDFTRIKTQMRAWAKGAAIKDIATIQDIGEEQRSSLMANLSRVAVIENNQLPGGLLTPKGPSLLLNALLAHDLYTFLFQSPFYFLNGDLEDVPTGLGVDDSLNEIYRLALDCK